MKMAIKRLKTLGLILLVCIVALPMLGWGMFYFGMFYVTSHNYQKLEDADDGFVYLLRDGKMKAGVSSVTYDPASGSSLIVIPESYGDYPVVGLGGYVGKGGPSPFDIEVKGVRSTVRVSPSYGYFGKVNGKKVNLIYHDVTLNLGPNIKEIYADQHGLYVETEGDRGEVHVVRVFVNCDPANRSFYSEDGRLYDKKGKLVEGFFWWDEEFIS